MKTSQQGIAKILSHEGERLTAYFDIAGVATISVGVTDGVTAQDVYNKRTITKDESQAMFATALAPREEAVDRLCKVKPNQNQFDALVSLVYNIGEGAFARSTVLKLHNSGDFAGAAKAFQMWNKAKVNGVLQPVAGLTNRRIDEANLYSIAADSIAETSQFKSPIISMILAIFKFAMSLIGKKG